MTNTLVQLTPDGRILIWQNTKQMMELLTAAETQEFIAALQERVDEERRLAKKKAKILAIWESAA